MILVKVHEPEHVVTHRIEVFPCIIGRSLHCALRIDEPSISARHAEVHTDGDGYWLRDLGSTNGISRQGEWIRELRLGAQETLYLGDVRLDFLTADVTERTHGNRMLPEDLSDNVRWLPAKIVGALVFALLVIYLVPAVDQYQVSWPPDNPGDLIGRAIVLWLGVVGAAFLVSLFCKLNAKRFHFHNVLYLISGAFVAVKAATVVTPMLIFNLHNLTGARYLRHLGYAVITFLFVFRLQRYALRRWRTRHRAMVALAAAVLAIVLTALLVDRRLGDRDRIADLGVPFGSSPGLKQGADDLLFAIGLAIAAIDQERIKTLEKLEADRDGN